MTSPLSVVLDTNVVLSALVFGGGQAGKLRRAWQAGAVVPLASAVTVQDLVRVLAYPKFSLSRAEQDELLADFLPYAQTVRMPQPPPPGSRMSRPAGRAVFAAGQCGPGAVVGFG